MQEEKKEDVTLTECAYAKINIGLYVGMPNPLDNWYHGIWTNFHLIDLHDVITIKVGESSRTSVTIKGNEGIVEPERDLMCKAAHAFSEYLGITFSLKIKIEKHIPTKAGLGGGSSDAGCVLRLLNKAFGSPLGEPQVLGVALSLGSDVPFFASGLRAAHATGRGERLTPSENVKALCLIVRGKDKKPSTGEQYRRLDQFRWNRELLEVPPLTKNIKAWTYRNSFDALQPILSDTVFLEAKGMADFGTTCGSGNCQALLFASDAKANICQKFLEEHGYEVMKTSLL